MSNNLDVQSKIALIGNRRERALAIVLIAAIVVGGAYQTLGSNWSWSGDTSLTLNQLSSEYERLSDEIERHESVTLAAQKRQAASLPADGVLAATRYYAWLHELAGRHGLTEIRIDNTAPIADSALGNRIQFSLQARANMKSLGAFLDQLQSYDLLHSINHLQLQDYSPLSKELRVQLNIETLSLNNGQQTDLPEFTGVKVDGNLASYLADHNPFHRYEPPKPVVTATVASVPMVDPLSKVTFVGVVQRGGIQQAWFYDSLNSQEMLLSIGSQLSVGDFVCQLKSLDDSSASLANATSHWSIQLGQNLRASLGTPQ